MTTMNKIEQAAADYAAARAVLSQRVSALHMQIDRLRHDAMPAIKDALGDAVHHHAALKDALDEATDLFEKPRTRICSGIKVGYTKQRGEVTFDDEQAVINRIRQQLPKDQVELLVKVKESVVKGAVYDLLASDLKRLGIRIENDSDVVVIRPVDSEVDKLVAALLVEAEKVGEAVYE